MPHPSRTTSTRFGYALPWDSGILLAVNNGSIPAVRAASVSDGLSHTLIVAESVDRTP
jgi:hypothetical protein